MNKSVFLEWNFARNQIGLIEMAVNVNEWLLQMTRQD